ncbi:MAG: response regulator [Saprospiraceae bacterium]|nr:response regulator [Saprospiraceae bacterium]
MEEKKHILIIEDESSLRLLLGKYLSKFFEVNTKKDGLEALSWMSQGNIPDAVILDMEMPRLNGAEFLLNIRSSGFFKHLPVIVVSGSSDKDLPGRMLKLGANTFIEKPLNPIKVKETIYHLVSSKDKAA